MKLTKLNLDRIATTDPRWLRVKSCSVLIPSLAEGIRLHR